MEKRKNRRKGKRISSIILTVMVVLFILPFTGNMTVYADSESVTQKCPEEVHGGCSHSSVQYHFYSTGSTYIPENWPSFEDPVYYVEGILYNGDVEAEGIYQGQEKIICAKDTAYSFGTSYFKNGFSEGWYYDNGDGFYPCTESGTTYYTLSVIDGSVTAGGDGPCASIAQGASATIKANEAPDGKVFDKWVVSAAGLTTDEARNAVILESAMITSTAAIVMPNENIEFRATYKTKPTVTPNFSTSPANASIVENMNEVVLTFLDNEYAYFSNLDQSYTYLNAVENSEGVTVCGATLSYDGVGNNQIKLTVESEITTAGAYTISIPGGVIKVDGTEITEAITLTYTVSSSTPTTYKVSFNANGHGTSPAEQIGITSGNKATKPADPTETGYTFDGWYKEPGCTNVWDFDTDTVTKDTELYAKWTPNTPSISFYKNGGDWKGGYLVPSTYTVGVGVTLPTSESITRVGYTFAGWTESDSASDTTYKTVIGTEETEAKTYYAKWIEKTASLTFNANGGISAPDAITMKYTIATMLPAAITREGYSFVGWNTQEDGKGTNYDANAQYKAANDEPVAKELFAKWNANHYTIAYDGNGSTSGTTEPLSTSYDIKTTLCENRFTRTGYTFAGWNTKADGTGTDYADRAKVSNLATSGTVILYAKWTPNTPSITFDKNGGDWKEGYSAPSTYTVGVGLTLPASGSITRVGYSFVGWTETNSASDTTYKTVIGTEETEAKTYFAKWIPTYTVTLDANKDNQSTVVTKPDGAVEEKTTKISADGRTEAVIEISYYVDGKLAEASLGVAQITEDNTMFFDFSDLKEAISRLGEDVLSKGAEIEIKLTSKDENGAVRHTIAINAKDLQETEFVVYAIDKQGNPVIVNSEENHVKIEESGEMVLNIAGTGDFQLFNTADAKVAEKAILKTITPKKKNDSVKKGQKITFKLSSKCNKDNISKITYKTNNKNVKVDKSGNIKGEKKGKATVTATITLKNGKQKKVEMKVKVK